MVRWIGLLCIGGLFIMDPADNVNHPPVETFLQSCSNCHNYELPENRQRLTAMPELTLSMMVEDMMWGPAMLTPDAIDVDVMVAYHRALSLNEPFAVVINHSDFQSGKEKELKLEYYPVEATVSTEKGSVTVESKTRVSISDISPQADSLMIRLVLNDKYLTFYYPQMITSH